MKFKKSWLREKIESVEKSQSSVIIKIFLIPSFYIMQQKIEPHLGFGALTFSYIPIIPEKFEKISWVPAKIERVEKRKRSVIIKIYLIEFCNKMNQKIDPQPRFLRYCFYLHSNYTYGISKK